MNTSNTFTQSNSNVEWLNKFLPETIVNIKSFLDNIDYLSSTQLEQKAGWFLGFHEHLPQFKVDINLPKPMITQFSDDPNILKQILREELTCFSLFLQLVQCGNAIEKNDDHTSWLISAVNELNGINYSNYQRQIAVEKRKNNFRDNVNWVF